MCPLTAKSNWDLKDVENVVFFYLDRKSTLNARLVCTTWNKNQTIVDQYKKIIETIYPLEAVKVFEKNGYNIVSFAVIQMFSDYMDFLARASLQGHAIVNIVDTIGRRGIAFRIRGNQESNKKNSGIVIFHETSVNDRSYKVDMSINTFYDYKKLHDPTHVGGRLDTCPTCPPFVYAGGLADYVFLDNLLTGKDIGFKISID